MNPGVGRVAPLSGVIGSRIRIAICANLFCAVGLVVVLTLSTLSTGVDLGTDTNSLTHFGERHLRADTENFANDLVTDS